MVPARTKTGSALSWRQLVIIVGLPLLTLLLAAYAEGIVVLSRPAIVISSSARTKAVVHAVVPSVPATPQHTPELVPASPAAPPGQRRATGADLLPADVFDDGSACAVGCRPTGAIPGWPLKPFHQQHPLRSGLNELRDSSFHHGFDIQARDGAKVYAVQPGRAHVLAATGDDSRVQVGSYIYWHVVPAVSEGEWVRPYATVVGTVKRGFGHLHFSEVDANNNYLNPFRPRGRVLVPWRDNAGPVIAPPRVSTNGRATVVVSDQQSFRQKITYWTPEIAPAAIAWRLWGRSGKPLGGLHFALRGSQNLPWSDHSLVFAPGARDAGFACFRTHAVCVPHWNYVLAGGLAPRIIVPRHGTSRLTIYAWDWAGNVRARDVNLRSNNDRIRQANK